MPAVEITSLGEHIYFFPSCSPLYVQLEPMPVYLENSLILFNRIYSRVSMYRCTAFNGGLLFAFILLFHLTWQRKCQLLRHQRIQFWLTRWQEESCQEFNSLGLNRKQEVANSKLIHRVYFIAVLGEMVGITENQVAKIQHSINQIGNRLIPSNIW